MYICTYILYYSILFLRETYCANALWYHTSQEINTLHKWLNPHAYEALTKRAYTLGNDSLIKSNSPKIDQLFHLKINHYTVIIHKT